MFRLKSVLVLLSTLVVSVIIATTAIMAGASTPGVNDSSEPVHLFILGSNKASGTEFKFTDNVIGGTTPSDQDYKDNRNNFHCPTASTYSYVFVSARGSERAGISGDGWKAFTEAGFTAGTTEVSHPNLKISGMGSGFPGAQAVKFTGGDYSLGLACTSNDGVTVDAVSYLYISIKKETGLWTAQSAASGTFTPTATPTPTLTATPTATSTPSPSATPTRTPTPTPTPVVLAPVLPVSPPTWLSANAIYQVNLRQYTQAGNFAAFKEQIPRLKALGFKVLSFLPLTPISTTDHEGTLGSVYAPDNYKAVDGSYGTSTEFKNLVTYAHQNGFKILVGWNAQATGWDHSWITEHKDWYLQDSSGAILSPTGGTNLDKASLNFANSDMRLAMIDAMKYWVTFFNVDGFACANTTTVPTDFWDRAAAEVNAVKPSLWIADSNTQSDLFVNTFAAGYNVDLFAKTNGILPAPTKASTLMSALKLSKPAGGISSPLNFLSNDIQNTLSGSETKRLGKALSLAAAMDFVAPGVPFVYSGQEVGSTKSLKANDKDYISWPTSSKTASFYRSLLALKRSNAALWSGAETGALVSLATNNKNILAFSRTSATNKVIFVANPTSKTQTVAVTTGKSATNLFDFASLKKSKVAAKQTLKLAAYGFKIYSTVPAK